MANEIDIITNHYIGNNSRFADVVNYKIYDGKPIVNEDDLKELDPSEYVLLDSVDDGHKLGKKKRRQTSKHKYRDILRYCEIKKYKNTVIAIFGIENQTKIHYAMPVRAMLYDAINYDNQIRKIVNSHKDKGDLDEKEFISGLRKEDKLIPVITITLYWGQEDWDGPETLKEMLETDDESILKYVGDYSINLISLNKISEDKLKNFKTSLKYVIEAIQCASSEEKWDNLLSTEEAFKNLDKESADTINMLTGLDLDIKTSEEGSGIDMCKAWDDHKQSGIREGIELGRTEGIKEGIKEGITILINYSKELGVSYDNTKIALINKYNISSDEAEKYMSENWK